MRPHRPVLLMNVEVRIGNTFRQHQPVVFHALGFSQFLKLFCAKHFTKRIRGIYRAINDDMRHVDAFGRKLGIQRLA